MNLLLLEPSEIAAEGLATIDGARARHLRQVLRAEPGRAVRVGVVDGPMGVGTVLSIDHTHARLACSFDAAAPPVPPVDLLLALPRPKVLQRLWAQLAALGVGRIVLTNAWRVERNYFDTTVLDPAVYRPLLIEGLQQARDTRVPIVSVHRQFRVLVEDDLDRLCPQTTRLLADPGADVSTADVRAATGGGPHDTPTADVRAATGGGPHDTPTADVRAATGDGPHDTSTAAQQARGPDAANGGVGTVPARARDRMLLAVGPEGGWNDFERRLLESRGFRRISLGPRTLRTDTACIALHTFVMTTLVRPSSLGVDVAAGPPGSGPTAP
jgi:16S rRNA U1498 N3-methylase RsmE